METVVKALAHASFSEIAERTSALYDEKGDSLLLGMLGQEYVIRREGISLHGQKAPENQASVILDYLVSPGTVPALVPWRTMSDFMSGPSPDFRKKVELPISQYASEVITRAQALMPMFDATAVGSLIGSDMALVVRALPRISLRVELSQETQDFPVEAWVLFSHNANAFLSVSNLQALAELFKDRLLSLLRIY